MTTTPPPRNNNHHHLHYGKNGATATHHPIDGSLTSTTFHAIQSLQPSRGVLGAEIASLDVAGGVLLVVVAVHSLQHTETTV